MTQTAWPHPRIRWAAGRKHRPHRPWYAWSRIPRKGTGDIGVQPNYVRIPDISIESAEQDAGTILHLTTWLATHE